MVKFNFSLNSSTQLSLCSRNILESIKMECGGTFLGLTTSGVCTIFGVDTVSILGSTISSFLGEYSTVSGVVTFST
jgi:hypothetical protein